MAATTADTELDTCDDDEGAEPPLTKAVVTADEKEEELVVRVPGTLWVNSLEEEEEDKDDVTLKRCEAE